jgi:hypothetical protein
MEVLEKAREMERQGINVVHLEVGGPDFHIPAGDENENVLSEKLRPLI